MYILVLNKEAGMVVHPGHGHFSGTLVNALAHHLGISQGPDAQDERMGVLVHRIDKDTSGLLVVAKNDEAQLNLAKQLVAFPNARRANWQQQKQAQNKTAQFYQFHSYLLVGNWLQYSKLGRRFF